MSQSHFWVEINSPGLYDDPARSYDNAFAQLVEKWNRMAADAAKRFPDRPLVSFSIGWPHDENKKPLSEGRPEAAYFIDATGCEHMSRDVANIEKINADLGGGYQITYLFSSPVSEVTDIMVEAACKNRHPSFNQWLKSSQDMEREKMRSALEAAVEAYAKLAPESRPNRSEAQSDQHDNAMPEDHSVP